MLLIAACGGGPGATAQPGQPTAQPGQPTAPAGQPTSPPVVSGAGTSTVHIVVASGPQAGTYDETGIKFDCNIAAGGSGATYVDTAVTEGVSSLPFTSIEGGTSPTKFYFQVLFGAPTATQAFLEIQTLDPATARGSGTASLIDSGSTIKWARRRDVVGRNRGAGDHGVRARRSALSAHTRWGLHSLSGLLCDVQSLP